MASPILHKGQHALALRHSRVPIGQGGGLIARFLCMHKRRPCLRGLGHRDGGERRNGEVSGKYR